MNGYFIIIFIVILYLLYYATQNIVTGLTAAAVLCLATWPFRNIIGFIYISEDNKNIKISSVNYWGKRVDKIIPTDDWIPLMDMSPKPMDAVFLSPQLADGTQYKLLLRFGKILNAKKMGEVLE